MSHKIETNVTTSLKDNGTHCCCDHSDKERYEALIAAAEREKAAAEEERDKFAEKVASLDDVAKDKSSITISGTTLTFRLFTLEQMTRVIISTSKGDVDFIVIPRRLVGGSNKNSYSLAFSNTCPSDIAEQYILRNLDSDRNLLNIDIVLPDDYSILRVSIPGLGEDLSVIPNTEWRLADIQEKVGDVAQQTTLLQVKQSVESIGDLAPTVVSQQATIAAQSERILAFDGEVAEAYDYLKEQGAIMPKDKTVENLPATIEQVVSAVTDMRVNSIAIDPNTAYVDLSHIVIVSNSKIGNIGNNRNIRSVKGLRIPGVLDISYQFDTCRYLAACDMTDADTSNVTNMSNMFQNCSALQELDLSGFDTSNVTNMSNMFYGCNALQELDLSGFDTSNVTNMSNMFRIFSNVLRSIDLTSFSAERLIYLDNYSFPSNSTGALFSFVGGRTYEQVVEQNITVLRGISINASITNATTGVATPLDRASLRALLNGLADRTGQSALTLRIERANIARLSEEDLQVAYNKNWNVV